MKARWKLLGWVAGSTASFLLGAVFFLLWVRNETHLEAKEIAELEFRAGEASRQLQALESAVADATRSQRLIERVDGILQRPEDGQVIRVKPTSPRASALGEMIDPAMEGGGV